MLRQRLDGLSGHFIQEAVLAKKNSDEQILFTLVVEVVSSDLLPWAI